MVTGSEFVSDDVEKAVVRPRPCAIYAPIPVELMAKRLSESDVAKRLEVLLLRVVLSVFRDNARPYIHQ